MRFTPPTERVQMQHRLYLVGPHHRLCSKDTVRLFVGLLLAYEIAHASPLVVGINFVGPETHPIAVRDNELHMRMLGELAAHYPDVKRSLHAGEMRDEVAVKLGAEQHTRRALASAEAGGTPHRFASAVIGVLFDHVQP